MNQPPDVCERLDNLSSRYWTLLVALAFGLIGVIFAAVVLAIFFDVNVVDGSSSSWTIGLPYIVSAWISGAVIGGSAWWVLVEKPTNASDVRGLSVGGVAMLSTHFLMFAIPAAWGIASGWSLPALSETPGNPAGNILFHGVFTLFLLFPLSLPASGLVGRALARHRRRQMGERRTIDIREHLRSLSSRGWTLLVASTFGLGGLIIAIVVLWMFFPLLALAFSLAPGAGIGGFTIGGTLWWFAVEVRESPSSATGVVVGALTGFFSHFVMWFVASLGNVSSLGDPYSITEFIGNTAGTAMYVGGLSFLFTGIITVPVGAYIGERLVRLRQSTEEDAALVFDGPTDRAPSE